MLRIERMGAADWERFRAVRLRALRETPDAFSSTLEESQGRAPEQWRRRMADPKAATFIACKKSEDLGLVTGAQYEGRKGAAGLFGLWVAPKERSAGVASLLVEAVIDWARSAGYERIFLDVGDANIAAIRLYERMGFMPTGEQGSLPPPRTHIGEHERVLEL